LLSGLTGSFVVCAEALAPSNTHMERERERERESTFRVVRVIVPPLPFG
jgi:hypothetical protein